MKRAWFRKWTRVIADVVFVTWTVFALADAMLPIHFRVHYSPAVYDAEGRVLAAYLSADEKWRFHAVAVPTALKKAIVHKEDKRFYFHPGVDALAALRAAAMNLVTGKRTSGASTITMQVVRLLYPGPRTYAGKLFEAFYALRLEYRLTKEQILGLYFDLLPYGGNIEGVEAAARFYFQKETTALSPAQLTVLCVLPNRPNGLRPDRRGEELMRARNRWLDKFKSAGIWSDETVERAKIEPLSARRRPLQILAPHFCRKAVSEAHDAKRITTTLVASLQARAQECIKSHVRRLKYYRIGNAAAVVVENRSRAIRAYVGSADFDDAAADGQVDGAAAVRSPGSALKPLIYALAMERGLTPKRMLLDAPANFGGFRPENYDRRYRGPVSAEEALAQSLNIPAVELLEQIGMRAFTETLIAAGFEQIGKDAPKLGLAAALGGCGVRLTEMAGLYAAIADGGRWRPLRGYSHDLAAAPTTLFSESTAQIIGEILRRRDRPDLPAAFTEAADAPQISWKTGTSYGRRDAWACGFSAKYTIAVWTGNFNGDPSPYLTGADVAVPILFDLFSLVEPRHTSTHPRPIAVPRREVCSHTGLPPGPFCASTVMDVYVKPTAPVCEHRKEFWVSQDGKVSYCPECKPESGAVKRIYENWPAAWAAYFEREKLKKNFPPPHFSACPKQGDSQTRIVFPTHGASIFLMGKKQKFRAQAYPDARSHTVHWFLNDVYVGASSGGESPEISPDNAGKHKLTVRDDLGGKHSVTFDVKKHR
jgi:penicillin-binding protein 1C